MREHIFEPAKQSRPRGDIWPSPSYRLENCFFMPTEAFAQNCSYFCCRITDLLFAKVSFRF